jgi:hypothetical protein
MDVVPAEALQRDVIDREEAVGDGNRALWWYKCVLVYFSWLLNHVTYLKLRRE